GHRSLDNTASPLAPQNIPNSKAQSIDQSRSNIVVFVDRALAREVFSCCC
uniref:Uncharacterized protein n=1 Tax=Aegilops tauschii subsp. strangulata TaxID=200361 RepID=A0A453IQZ4_AEGTS